MTKDRKPQQSQAFEDYAREIRKAMASGDAVRTKRGGDAMLTEEKADAIVSAVTDLVNSSLMEFHDDSGDGYWSNRVIEARGRLRDLLTGEVTP